MTHRSLLLTLVVLSFCAAAAGFGFLGGLCGASLRAPGPPPAPANAWPLPPPPACAACPACPMAPALPPAPVRRGVLFTASGLPSWGSGYETSRLADGDPSTYWCSPASPTLPLTGALMFESPAFVEAVEIDNRLAGYESSGAREVRIEALDLGGAVLASATVTLDQASSRTVPLSLAVVATGLRVTVLSNFGGDYAGIAEIVVHGRPAG